MAIVKKEKAGSFRSKRAAKEEPPSKFKLSTETTEPVDDLGDCLTLIYGMRKIGKTSMIAHAPKTTILATEVGYKGLRLVKEDIGDWDKAQTVLRALKHDKHFRSVAVDTVDLLYRMAEKYTCRDLGVDELGDADWGKGFSACRKRLSDYLNGLSQTGKGVFLISHANEQSIRRREGGEFDRMMPTMAKQAREVIEPMIDIWGCYQYDDDRRILTIVGDEHLSAGHRFEERFRTPDGRRIRNIDMGTSAGQAWENFSSAFHNRYEPTREEDIVREDRRRPKKSDGPSKTFKLKRK